MGSTRRKIDGKYYGFEGGYGTKSRAQGRLRQLKNRGYASVRIIYDKPNKLWDVWARKTS